MAVAGLSRGLLRVNFLKQFESLNTESSVKSKIFESVTVLVMSLIKSAKRNGEKEPPCGTPEGEGNALESVRCASKKTGGSSRNRKRNSRPKHRGVRVQDRHYVQAGTILATQLDLRFHPGLNVGFGKNGTLFAIEAGQVAITCEKIDPNWDHTWIQRIYEGRRGQTIYKKFFNVIAEPQHTRFKLIDEV